MNGKLKLTREQWLNEAASLICLEIIAPGVVDRLTPPYRISVAPLKTKRLGQCHQRAQSEDGTNEIFITAHCDCSLDILSTLVHELIHAYDDCESKHRGFFRATATACGLEGKMTATKPSDTLTAQLQEYIDILGPIPHAALAILPKGRGRNNNKLVCTGCGFQANLSAKWCLAIEKRDAGLLICPACDEPTLIVERAA
jgi:hypothetical protein